MPTLTSDFFYAPDYKTLPITLKAHADALAKGTIIVKNGADFEAIGAADATVYGVLLNDAPASESEQAADIITFGELFKQYVGDVYKAANGGDELPDETIDALRAYGILLK